MSRRTKIFLLAIVIGIDLSLGIMFVDLFSSKTTCAQGQNSYLQDCAKIDL